MEQVMTNSAISTKNIGLAIAGSLFIAIGASISIPTQPIAITLQTLALFILGLTASPKICLSSVTLYLLAATAGAPILSTFSNPLWFVGPTAGYLFAFPLATYTISRLAYGQSSITRQAMAALAGLTIIYTLGCLWLSLFVGMDNAFSYGVLFFLKIDCLKIALAIAAVRTFHSFSSIRTQ